MPEAAAGVAVLSGEAEAKAAAATAVAAAASEDTRQQAAREADRIQDWLGEMGLGMYAEGLQKDGWNSFEV
jgi:hypothetical protein